MTTTTAQREETMERLKEQAEAKADKTTTVAPKTTTPEETTTARDYTVFAQTEDGTWKSLATVEATSTAAAIKACGAHLEDGVKVVAVTTRSWQPQTISIKQTTTISLT